MAGHPPGMKARPKQHCRRVSSYTSSDICCSLAERPLGEKSGIGYMACQQQLLHVHYFITCLLRAHNILSFMCIAIASHACAVGCVLLSKRYLRGRAAPTSLCINFRGAKDHCVTGGLFYRAGCFSHVMCWTVDALSGMGLG